jgi:hypothetical protein
MRTVPFALVPILAGVAFFVIKKTAVNTPTLFRIQEKNKIGYVDKKGKMVIPPVYFNGSDFSEGLAAVRQTGFYGYIEPKGNFVIEPQFDWADPFSDGLALVDKDGHNYYIDHSGLSAFPCNYNTLSSFNHGVAEVITYSGKCGLIDTKGKLILDTIYTWIRDFTDGLAILELETKGNLNEEGMVDTLGHFTIPIGKYKSINPAGNGYFLVENKSDEQIILDRKGRIVFKRPEINKSSILDDGFSDGIAPIGLYKYWEPNPPGTSFSSENSYMGFIDIHNNILLNDTTIESVRPFSCGRAFIRHKGSSYRMIDTYMHLVGKEEYRFVKEPGFVNGYAIVNDENGDRIIDTNGCVVFRPRNEQIDQIAFLSNNYFVEESFNGKSITYGIGTLKGRLICNPYLEECDRAGFANNLLKVVIAGKLALMDTSGNIVWKERSPQNLPLIPYNTDYMMRGYFYAYSAPDKNRQVPRSGGWSISNNIPKKIHHENFGPNALLLMIDTASVDTFSGAYRGYTVYLANTTRDTCEFNAEDSRLYLKTQAQTKDGNWKDIDYLPGSWCGNSYHEVVLEPGAYWKFVMPQFEGAIPVKLRLSLQCVDKDHPKNPKILYSNTILASINPAQYWNKRPYYPQNIMDPYTD